MICWTVRYASRGRRIVFGRSSKRAKPAAMASAVNAIATSRTFSTRSPRCADHARRPVQPEQRQQKTQKRNDVQWFPEPAPIGPVRDSSGELGRWRRSDKHLLKSKHLPNEVQTTPHAHDDVRGESDEKQAPNPAVLPSQCQ